MRYRRAKNRQSLRPDTRVSLRDHLRRKSRINPARKVTSRGGSARARNRATFFHVGTPRQLHLHAEIYRGSRGPTGTADRGANARVKLRTDAGRRGGDEISGDFPLDLFLSSARLSERRGNARLRPHSLARRRYRKIDHRRVSRPRAARSVMAREFALFSLFLSSSCILSARLPILDTNSHPIVCVPRTLARVRAARSCCRLARKTIKPHHDDRHCPHAATAAVIVHGMRYELRNISTQMRLGQCHKKPRRRLRSTITDDDSYEANYVCN